MADQGQTSVLNMYMPIEGIRAYEGASTNFKNSFKGLLSGEADQLAARELRFLQLRSDHAVRNNGYAKTALKRWVTNASSIKVIWKTKKGKKHKLMQDLWDEFCLNPNHDGLGDYNTMQGVSNSSIYLAGNSYIRKLIRRKGNSNKIPLKLQLIPANLHAIGYSTILPLELNQISRYGMIFQDGLPIKYLFRKGVLEHKWDDPTYNYAPIEVPANEMIHTFIRETPGQWLGIPMLASVLLALYELDELIDATISKQKAAQAIAMIVENANNTMNQLAVGTPGYRQDSDTGENKLVFHSQTSNVQYVNKGESVKMFQGADIGVSLQPLIISELRKIASVSDLMLHELTGDTSGLNFSSLIGLAIQSRNRLEYLHNFLFIPLRERPIADAFKELAVLYNKKVADAKPYFQLPRWRGMDDLKDNQADLLAVQNGMDTYENILAERGLSSEDIIADRETVKELEGYGIFLNSSASNPSMAQAKNNQASSATVGA
jgi:lambda family phage portal protein